jgi:hypothetical protein
MRLAGQQPGEVQRLISGHGEEHGIAVIVLGCLKASQANLAGSVDDLGADDDPVFEPAQAFPVAVAHPAIMPDGRSGDRMSLPDLWQDPADREISKLRRLRELEQEITALKGLGVAAYLHDPLGFVANCVRFRGSQGLTAYQEDIIGTFPQVKRMAVRGPRGLGKSCLASLIILWFAVTRDAAGIDWKIVTTAGSWQQLEDFLWREIGKWAIALDWERVGRAPFNARSELMKTQLSLRHGLALSGSPDKPEKLEGAHADSILYVFDESKIIAAQTFDAAEGAFSGAGENSDLEAYALAISTPGEPAGRFYDIHRHAPGLEDWHTRHVTLTEAVAAGRMTLQWAEQRKKLWGENSALYQNHVLGEFCADDEDAVIPLRWVEAAQERWRAWDKAGQPETDGIQAVGVDVARSGTDKTVCAIRHGDVVVKLVAWAKADTMETTGRVKGILASEPAATAVVDVIGIGAGVYDRLREMGLATDPFHAGRKTTRKDRTGQFSFFNLRSQAWWSLREMLEPPNATLALPPDDELAGDLTAMHYKHTSDGKIQVESKDDIRKRIGRSTDKGDAVIQCCFLTAGSWADAYRVTSQCPGCERLFRPDLPDGTQRTQCPHCKNPLDAPEDEAA